MNDFNCRRTAFFALTLISGLAIWMIILPAWPNFHHFALAQTDGGVQMEVHAGFDGLCKDATWIPVKVSLENHGENLEASLRIQSGGMNNLPATYTQSISLPATSHKVTLLYFFPDSYQPEIEVQLFAGQRLITQATAPINCLGNNDRLFGILSSTPSTFNSLADLDPPAGRASIARLVPEDLPDRAAAWQALDYLVISDFDTSRLATQQVEALDAWISAGGVLLVTGGPNWQASAAGIDSILPYHPKNTVTVSGLMGLSGEAVLSSGSLDQNAEIVIDQDETPLLIRGRHGAGMIYYLTADPGLEPLKSWEGMVQLYEQTLGTDNNSPVWADGFQAWDSASNAVSILPELALPPFNLLCGFLILYITVLGPVNYLVLRRMKRKELAWISVPVVVVAFSLLAFMVGTRGRGREPVISRLAVVQVWQDTRLADMNGLLGIFSPNRATYHLEVDRNFLAHPIPNNPMMTPTGGWLFETDYDQNTHIPELRIDVGDINALAVEGQIPSPSIGGNTTIQLTEQVISLEVDIQNKSGLQLQDTVLLSPDGTREIGDFNPGDRQQFQIILSDDSRASFTTTSPTSGFTGAAPFYPPYASTGSFITDMLGPGDYYRNQEIYRRFNLLNALSGYSNPKGRGGGIYLAGWSTESPISANLDEQQFRSNDTTLYIVELKPTVSKTDETIALPPGLFSWSVLDSSGGNINPAPYDGYLETGDFSLQFSLNQPVAYTKVNQLTLHLKSYDRQGPTGFNQYLWDFDQASWVLLKDVAWGDTQIANPDRFVSANGEIRLRLEQAGSQTYLPIERADFTLEVEP